MHCERREMCFRGTHHLNMISDPSTHSKQDFLIGLFYSWETGIAAYGDLQRIPPSVPFTQSEQDLPEELGVRVAGMRQERVSSLRELLAISHCISQLSSEDFPSIAAFSVPVGMNVSPVTEQQVRVVIQGQDSNIAWLVNSEENSKVRVWLDARAHTQ